MNKLLLSLILLVGWASTMVAQTDNYGTQRPGDVTGLDIGLAAFVPSFQDVRFTQAQYSGVGWMASLGIYKRTEEVDRYFGATFGSAAMSTSLNDIAAYTRLNTTLAYARQQRVGTLLGADWLVGGELRTQISLYNSPDEGNNSLRMYSNAALTGLMTLRFEVAGKPLSVGLGVGLLHFGRDNHSFAFSLSQGQIEDGEYAYEDFEGNSLLRGNLLQTLGGKNEFRGSLDYPLAKKLSLRYRWEVTRYTVVTEYPTTQASHLLGFGWTF